jgi:nitrate/nitrite-specific signal transduction histidine kinase
VLVRVQDGTLRIRVQEDGIGGARPDSSGLLGLADRLAVLHGQLWVENPPGGGTLVAADIRVPDSNPHGREGPMAFEAIVSDQFHHPGGRGEV